MADPWNLRPIERADLPALAELERASFPDPWTADQLSAALGWREAFGILAEDGPNVIGYLLGRVVVDEAEILSLATAPVWRRRGLGRHLLAAATVAMRARGAHTAWLEVRVSNAAARALYRAAGFAEIDVRRDYYRQPLEDALVLRCALA